MSEPLKPSDDLKEVRFRLDDEVHEMLSIMAEYHRVEIAALGGRLLTKAIVGEWYGFKKAMDRYLAVTGAGNGEKQPGRDSGYVYVIRIGERYKIGKAEDWRKRLSNAMFPEPPEVVIVIEAEDRHALEQELHRKYADVRLHGEWFGLQPEHLEELRKFPDVKGSA